MDNGQWTINFFSCFRSLVPGPWSLVLLLFLSSCAKQLTPAGKLAFDQKAVTELAQALASLPQSESYSAYDPKEVAKEARGIAKALVDQTRKTNKEFRMSGAATWHNFLIKLGIRKKGYCYHWVPELLKALPPYPLRYFERHWGASFLSMGRENNAVILTKRGAPLEKGLVYDAWRGVGRPYWRYVALDKKYKWQQRFSEAEILMGEAGVEPK